MKFTSFKEFRVQVGDLSLADIVSYLTNEMPTFLRDLSVGLTRLRLTENFEAFKVTVSIPAGTELAIRNELRSGAIPTDRIIVRGKSGAQSVVDGDQEWTKDFVYLKNLGGSSITVGVIFMR